MPNLSNEQINQYKEDGYIAVLQVKSDKNRVQDKFDILNMVEYGEDFNDDYIKFKFFS